MLAVLVIHFISLLTQTYFRRRFSPFQVWRSDDGEYFESSTLASYHLISCWKLFYLIFSFLLETIVRVWKGISGIRYLTKCGAGFGKTQHTILTGNGWILQLREKWNSPKFKRGMRDFFACMLRMWEIIRSSGKFQSNKTIRECALLINFLFYFIVFGEKKRNSGKLFKIKVDLW